MIRKLIFLFSLISFSFIAPKQAIANCNFKTGQYIKELNSPSSLIDIDIEIPKSKKYIKNYLETLLSTQRSSRSIKQKYKKKFKSNLSVNYKFGSCSFPAKVWQNGDLLDHLNFKGGKPIRSLNVKLDKGNILNATKFKLLIPRTRNGKHEILTTLIVKNLNIIAPETFEVSTIVNGTKTKMLFQEDSQKELLERNFRREGPIFEGDERLLWGDQQYKTFGNVGGGGFENISLAKLVNRRWFLKGKNSEFISLNALHKIQNAYLKYSADMKNKYYINPNNQKNDIFSDFNFLMLSLRGEHALRPHNRKYYFNSFNSNFEPIYYDGNIRMNRLLFDKSIIQSFEFAPNYIFPHLSEINSINFFKKIENQFKERIINYNSIDELFLKNNFDIFKKNVGFVQKNIKSSNKSIHENYLKNNYRDLFLKRNNLYNLEKNIIKKFHIGDNLVNLNLEDGRNIKVSIADFSRIIGRKKIDNELYVFLPKNNFYKFNNNLIHTEIGKTGTHMIYSEDMNFSFEKNKSDNKLFIYQSNPKDTLIIKNGILKDLHIVFIGAERKYHEKSTSQRFNQRGLTGCLNFLNTKLDNISIEVINGQCEDSLNIINSNGLISSIKVSNSYQDAIDLDFSDIKIKNIIVNSAGNDCLDVSGGSYNLLYANLSECQDKALSIGEKTKFISDNIFINNSEVGIAVKDLSTFDGRISNIKNTNICIHLFKKKQEFGGAFARLKDISCEGKYLIDNNSIIKFE